MPGVEARGCASLATRSGRGGTTGRCAGCPAKGRDGTRGALECELGGCGAPGPAARLLTIGWPGRKPSGDPAGRGARGPESTCPGFMAGTGRAGGGANGRPGAMTATGACMGAVTGGCVGAGCVGAGGAAAAGGGAGAGEAGDAGEAAGKPASGGRMGCEGRPTGTPCTTFSCAGSAAFGSGGGSGSGTGGLATKCGCVSTAADSSSGSSDGAGRSKISRPETGWPNSRRSLNATSSSIELE
jgi:hypothetical protein